VHPTHKSVPKTIDLGRRIYRGEGSHNNRKMEKWVSNGIVSSSSITVPSISTSSCSLLKKIKTHLVHLSYRSAITGMNLLKILVRNEFFLDEDFGWE
jgi:hypothetical protein